MSVLCMCLVSHGESVALNSNVGLVRYVWRLRSLGASYIAIVSHTLLNTAVIDSRRITRGVWDGTVSVIVGVCQLSAL